jgi:hypothetical protein
MTGQSRSTSTLHSLNQNILRKIPTLFLLLCGALSLAQNQLNALAGVNYSYFTDGIAGQFLAEESFGLHIGANYDIPLAKKISFRPGLAFSQIGDRTKTAPDAYGTGTEINQLDIKLSYLNIPLDIKFGRKFYLVAGPQFAVLLSQKSRFGSDLGSSADFGINIGTGFTVNRLFFEAGLYQGLMELDSFRYDDTGTTTKIHNGYAKFTVGYRLL